MTYLFLRGFMLDIRQTLNFREVDMETRDRTVLAAAMLIAGGIIGAGVALLLAPQSGDRTRRQIGRIARKARSRAEEMAREASESVQDLVEDLSSKTSELIEQGEDVASEWRNSFLHSLDRGEKALEKQRRRLARLWK